MTDRVTAGGSQGSGADDSTAPKRSPDRQLQAQASAVLDTAHLGDIEGAFGRIGVGEVGERHTWKQRLVTLAAIVGPGIIVMVGDNDAGGVSTYAQAGQNYHTTLLWTLLLLIPVLIVNQEMVVRLGAVTGVGHARLINERFGRGWGWFSVGDLFLLNFLTIVTEFIGISLAGAYAGVSEYVSVPITAAVALVAIMATGSFQKWERAMFAFIAISLVQIPMFFLSEPHWGTIAKNFVVPSIYGGPTSAAVLLIIAIVGTTVAPWQLFFQQSNIVDKRITPRFISYERVDTVIGSLVVVGGAQRRSWSPRTTGPPAAPTTSGTSPMLWVWPTCSRPRAPPSALCSPSSSSTPASSVRRRSPSPPATPSATCSGSAIPCTAASRTPSSSI